MPSWGMGSRPDLPPYLRLGFIPQVVEFIADDEPRDIGRQVFSHVHKLAVGQCESESRVQLVSSFIDHFWHGDVI